jgi:hypothetical protein
MSRVLDAFNELRDNVQGKPWFEITEIAGRRHCAADWEAGARPLSGGRSRSYLDATRVGCGLESSPSPRRSGWRSCADSGHSTVGRVVLVVVVEARADQGMIRSVD